MNLHGNARTCPKSRRLLVDRLEGEWSLTEAAEAAGVSERTAAKWLSRWRAEGETGLLDRSSAPKTRPTQLPADRIKAIEALRRLRMTAAEIAECLGLAISTVSRWLGRIGLGKLSRLEPVAAPNRYERKRPGELIHVDIKKLARISSKGAGHRVTGVRGPSLSRRTENGKQRNVTGWEFIHVCVDDATRLAYVEVLADERGPTAAGFLRRGGSLACLDGNHGGARDERQRRLLHLKRPCRGLQGAWLAPSAHASLQATDQRQGGALHPDAHPSLGTRCDLRQLLRAQRSPIWLAQPLQLHPTTRLSRPQAARSSARRAGTTSWVTTTSS